MKFKFLVSATAAAVACVAAPAMAQDRNEGSFYVGGQIGYHDLSVGNEANVPGVVNVDDAGLIYGGVIGLEFNVGESPVVLGVEANGNLGDGPIESEYGVLGFVGYEMTPSTMISLRGGYQEVRFDYYELLGLTEGANIPVDRTIFGLDQTADDYLVGVGARFMLGDNLAVRGAVDTLGFDTVRGTVGLSVHFR